MVNRITGLSTGFDVDGTVAKLMAAQRIPLDKLSQDKQWLTWQTADYRTMNSKILDLRNSVFSMKLDATFQSKKGTSSSDSVASVTATANSTEGVYTLQVNKLAAAASLTTSGGLGGDTSKTLGDPAGINLSADTTLTIGGSKGTATINVKKADTFAQFISNVNSKSNVTGVKLNYDATLDRMFFVSTSTGAATQVDLKSQGASFLGNTNGSTGLKLAGVSTINTGEVITATGARTFASNNELIDNTLTGTNTRTLRLTYNGVNYDDVIDSSKTIGQVIDELNGSAFGKTGVSAYLDSSGHLAFFNPDNTKFFGVNDATTPPQSTNIVTTMGLDTSSSAAVSFDTVNTSAAYKAIPGNGLTNSVTGQDADILFNNVHGTYATNTFTVGGMSLTVKTGSGATTNITVAQDVDSVFNSIKSFVDKYNDTISVLNSKISEKKNRDYAPLTDAQKQNMKDADIQLWTDNAKSGTLRNDSIISTALSSFRSSLSRSVTGIPSGDYQQLSQIGITTGSYQENGKLYIDEAKLRDAIATHPDQVQKLFAADDGSVTSDDGKGLAIRMYTKAQNAMTQITAKAGASTSISSMYLLGKRMDEIDTKVSKMNVKLSDIETRYYNQFTAMETAINNMNAQNSAFLSQLGK
jgi:flagellar hook-associated protein 2